MGGRWWEGRRRWRKKEVDDDDEEEERVRDKCAGAAPVAFRPFGGVSKPEERKWVSENSVANIIIIIKCMSCVIVALFLEIYPMGWQGKCCHQHISSH